MKKPPFWAWIGIGFCLVCLLFPQSLDALNSLPGENHYPISGQNCDNATDGGEISGDEQGCPNPIFDPSIIVNVVLPSGGSGNLEYIWIYTTVDPLLPVTSWIPLPGSNAPDYDPGPITTTTWFRRCARREGCDDYVAESNYVVKEIYCCDNFTDGGLIGEDQEACEPFDPAEIDNVVSPTGGSGNPSYFWYQSTVSGSFDPATWTLIPGANELSYDPPFLSQTTWFIRFSQREPCTDSVASNIVQLQINASMTLEAEIEHITCFGEGDGSIDLTVKGGTPNFSFLWNTGSTDEDLSNLTPGIYSVTVTDALDCSVIGHFEILQPGLLELEGTIVHPTCFGGSDGSITLEVNGGTPPYTFVWDNAPNVQNPSSLGAGTYSVTVTDTNGCSESASFQLIVPPSISVEATIEQPDCIGGSTGSIVLTVTGGTPGYSYLWSTGATTKDLVDVMAGLYVVTVTDSQGCTAILEALLHEPGGLMVEGIVTPILCFGESTGAIHLTVSGGTPPYSFLWSNGSVEQNLVNLGAGSYTVTVEDDNGCSFISTYVVSQPANLVLGITKIDVTCFGGNDGTATVSVFGGTAPYTYLWSTVPAQTTATATGLSSGPFSVTVTDDKGCQAVASIIIGQPANLVLGITKIDVTCFGGNNGTATVTVTGGTAPYTYLWNTVPAQNMATATGLSAGPVFVTVTDNKGCQAVTSIIIGQPANLVLGITKTDVTCFGGNDGNATVSVSGGTAPYSYLWSTVPAQTTGTATGLSAGSVSVTVTDNKGCQAVTSIIIGQPANLVLGITKTDVTCFGGNDGTAIVSVSGGTAPYSYLWSTVPAQTTGTAIGLSAGSVSVTVTDNTGCSAVTSIIIGQPANLVLGITKNDVTCFGGNDGSATVSVSGGTAPYTYLWNTVPAQTTATATGLSIGSVSVTVTDDEGCQAVASIIIGQPAIMILSFEKEDQSCIPKLDGEVEVFVEGGTPPYAYLWDDPSGATTSKVTGLAPGEYFVTVTDANGCSIIGNQTIEAATENCDCTTRIGDYVWYDFNRDGIQNTNEQGLNGITVHLSQAGPDGEFGTDDDVHIKTTFTSGSGFDNGKYIFEDVCPGTYAVCFDIDTIAYQFTLPLQGLDPAKDSDAQPSTGCTLPFTITSNPGEDLTLDAGIHEICVEVTDPGVIGHDEELCYPGDTPSKIISIEDPSGGVDPLQYMWIQSDIEPVFWVGNANWKEIPGAIDKEYQPGPIQKTTYYLRCVRSENCWDWSESNLITKTVIDPQAIILNTYPGPICINRPYLFQAKNQALPATYFWEFGPNATPATVNGVSISNVQWPTEGPITIKLTVTIGNCVDSVTLYYDAIECGWKTAFIDFSAVLTANEKVDLNWSGSNWDNNYVYLVERSPDQQSWEYLLSVVGKPFEVSNYYAEDPKPLAGESFYRIRLVDVAGDKHISSIERIFYRPLETWELEFYPNPFSDHLRVSLLEPLTVEGEVYFYDFRGRLLDVQRIPTGVRTYEINVDRWPVGPILAYIYLDGLRPYARKIVRIK